MTDMADETEELLIEEEMKESYLTFAMSVIVSRALPDVRDGLKPVQRRILKSMDELNLGPQSSSRKCGKIVGDTGGNYHPHGDSAIYDALVRICQPFTMRYPLGDGQGNFGSMDGDPPAAMRYTEARLSNVGLEMLRDLHEDTVDFEDNYDNTREEPVVLPARFPNLLANGASGIAVGMATSIPPHNVGEICDALLLLLDNPDATIPELMEHLPAPDFPCGGIICGTQGAREAYTTGRGTITVRGCTSFEENRRGRESIVITEVPYQTDRDKLTAKIADGVESGNIEGISDVRNESDREGTRIVVDLRRGADRDVVLNQLFRHSPLQTTVGIRNIAIVNGRPRTLNLKQMLEHYRNHRIDVIERRTRYRLSKAEARAHVLEGLRIALLNIDDIIEIIRGSEERSEAQDTLMTEYELTERQADAILNMRLSSLVGLERVKVEQEYEDLQEDIEEYNRILADRERVLDMLRDDLRDIKDKFGDERRTAIGEPVQGLKRADLIREEDVTVTVSEQCYVKRTNVDEFRAQGRGGKGVRAADLKDEDSLRHLFYSSTHDYALMLTTQGLAYWLRVFRIPEMSRTSRGRALVNLLDVSDEERVVEVLPVTDFDAGGYVAMATTGGKVKKTPLDSFGKRGNGGIIAVDIPSGDDLVGACWTSGADDIVLGTRGGRMIRFSEDDVRPMGRNAAGVKGISPGSDDSVADIGVVPGGDEEHALLTVCENGYGKLTEVSEYPLQGRGGQGVIGVRTPERNGELVAVSCLRGDEQLMMITRGGQIVRIPADSISRMGRNTQGVRLMKTEDDDTVTSVVRLDAEVEEEDEEPDAGE